MVKNLKDQVLLPKVKSVSFALEVKPFVVDLIEGHHSINGQIRLVESQYGSCA